MKKRKTGESRRLEGGKGPTLRFGGGKGGGNYFGGGKWGKQIIQRKKRMWENLNEEGHGSRRPKISKSIKSEGETLKGEWKNDMK